MVEVKSILDVELATWAHMSNGSDGRVLTDRHRQTDTDVQTRPILYPRSLTQGGILVLDAL